MPEEKDDVMTDNINGPSLFWRGFLIESLHYMNYSGLSKRGKFRFWRRFPSAAFRYYRATLLDNLR